MKSLALLFREFCRSPTSVGAIAPSSSYLAKEIVELAQVSSASAVLEIGPGTGVFTAEILEQLRSDANFIAIEKNPRFISTLKTRFPTVSIIDDGAENAPSILAQRGLDTVDAIVSGLPWASFSSVVQDRLLDSVDRSLADGGMFVTFAYLQGLLMPSGKRFRKRLEQIFSQTKTSRVIWKNVPPAFIYVCTKQAEPS